MRIYSYCFIASARADTRSHEVTWQGNYICSYAQLTQLAIDPINDIYSSK